MPPHPAPQPLQAAACPPNPPARLPPLPGHPGPHLLRGRRLCGRAARLHAESLRVRAAAGARARRACACARARALAAAPKRALSLPPTDPCPTPLSPPATPFNPVTRPTPLSPPVTRAKVGGLLRAPGRGLRRRDPAAPAAGQRKVRGAGAGRGARPGQGGVTAPPASHTPPGVVRQAARCQARRLPPASLLAREAPGARRPSAAPTGVDWVARLHAAWLRRRVCN